MCKLTAETKLDLIFIIEIIYVVHVERVQVDIYMNTIKAIHVAGRGGPKVCDTYNLSHFLDNWLTDDGLVSLTLRPPFTLRKIPGTHFC
jgi:hypothetical protein